MKVRHVLIIISTVIVVAIIGIAFKAGYSSGLKKGVADAEKIRAAQLEASQEGAFTQILFGVTKDKSINVMAKAMVNESMPITAKGFGQVISSSMINITSEVQGTINASIKLKKGTKFKKGQHLFSIQNADVRLALKARKSKYLTLLTSILPDIKLDYNDNFEAWLHFFSGLDVSKPLPPLPKTKSFQEKNFIVSRNVYTEYYSILSDQERLKKYSITAPFSGSIINAFTDNGAITAPGSPVLSVLREGNLEIEVPISASEIELVKSGATVKLYDEMGAVATGVVNRKGSYINPQTQTVPVFIDVVESTSDLYNGMYLNAEIACEGVEHLMELPRKALFNKNEIFIVRNNRIFARKVNVKLYRENSVLVSGIEDNTVIVVEPLLNGKDSLEVKILNPTKL